MICIRCKRDSKYPERPGRKCPGCGGLFAFEPRTGDPVTDTAFQRAIERVSARGSVRFDQESLYYAVCRTKIPKKMPLGCLVVPLVTLALAIVIEHDVRGFFVVVTVVASAVIILGRLFRKETVRIPPEAFPELFRRWVTTHGEPEGLIVRKQRSEKARPLESDLADYSFDRAVICDRERTVDLLLANNFHFENNCAVLSLGGYPRDVFDTVKAMLKKNPRLHVFALHDATETGCALAHRLAHDRAWFKDQAQVVDVGLRPVQARAFAGLYLPARARVAPGPGITAEEAAWLSRYSLELAAIRPEQVLKRLYRAVNRKLERDAERRDERESWLEFDEESFGSYATDAGSTSSGADGFG